MRSFYFVKEATAPVVSGSYTKVRDDLEYNMLVNIKGTATAFQLAFYGLLDGEWKKLPLITLPDFEIATDVSDKDKRCQIEISPYWEVRCEIESISGGNLTVMGSIFS